MACLRWVAGIEVLTVVSYCLDVHVGKAACQDMSLGSDWGILPMIGSQRLIVSPARDQRIQLVHISTVARVA